MILRNMIDEARHAVHQTLARLPSMSRLFDESAQHALDAAQLEDRVMLSAAPMGDAAINVAQAVDIGELAAQVAAVDQAPMDVAGADRELRELRWNAVEGDGEEQAATTELVFVDSSAAGYQQLVDELLINADETRDLDVYLLDADRDGVQQISEILSSYDDLDAVHLISHGSQGRVKLGSTWLSVDNLDGFAGAIATWNDSLDSDADILIYGCELAANDEGRALVDGIAALCDCDVAASVDDTGHAALGGDWDLEYATGAIEAGTVLDSESQQAWGHLLALETLRDEFNSVSYSNNDGSVAWSNDWQEIGENNPPWSGNVQVISALGEQGLMMWQSAKGAWREANLSTATSATLSFDYARFGLDDPSDYIVVEASADGGGSWYELDRFEGPAHDAAMQSASYDISAYIASNTQIRFVTSGLNATESLFVDNVQIEYDDTQAPGGITTNLNLWLRADAGVSTTGPNVNQWDNQVATSPLTSVTSSGFRRPDLNTGVLNSNPVISFDGSNDVLSANSVLGSTLFSSNEASIYTVTSLDASGGVILQWRDDTGPGNSNRVSIEDALRFDYGDLIADQYTTTPPANGYHILNAVASPSAPVSQYFNVDGRQTTPANASGNNPLDVTNTGNFTIGDYFIGGYADDIDLGEVIIFGSELTAVEQAQVDSYLAVKYGITLDQTTPTDYVNSQGVTIWDATANAGYSNDIAGIGRDLKSTLDQTQSRSINSDSVVTMSAASNQHNAEFLLWGNDDGALAEVAGELPSVVNRLDRIWRVDENGDVGATTIEFDLAGLTYFGTVAADFQLIVDSDVDFTSGATTIAATSYDSGTQTVTFTGVNLDDAEFFALGTEAATNTPPSATNLTQAIGYVEGAASIALDDIVVSDIDVGDSITARLTLTNTTTGSLTTGTFGSVTSTYNAGSGVWEAVGDVADVNAALASVAFVPTANNDADATITTHIEDAAGAGPADGSIAISVTPQNDAPTATNLTQVKAYTEGAASVALDDIEVTEVDNNPAQTITAQLTLANAVAGSLTTGTFGSVTSTFNAGTGLWEAIGDVADVNAALADVAFIPATDNDVNTTITTHIEDQDAVGPADGVITLNVTPQNDAPTASNLTQLKLYTEGAASVALDDIVVTEIDTNPGQTITAELTLNDVSTGTLTTGTFGSVTSTYNAGSGLWQAIGNVTDVNAALAGVAFMPTVNNDIDTTITTHIEDQDGDGPADGTITLDVAPQNDDPTNIGAFPAADLVLLEAGTVTVDLSPITLQDIDSGTSDVRVVLTTSNGGTLSASNGGGVVVTGSGTASLTLTGEVDDLNSYMDDPTEISFTGAAGVSGDDADSIDVIVNDDGNTGAGGGGDISIGAMDVDIAPRVITVTTTADENDGDTTDILTLLATPGGSGISLREAILATNNMLYGTTPDRIILPSGDYDLLGGELEMSDDVLITGGGARTTTVDALLASRVFQISGGTTEITGLTITGGNAQGGGAHVEAGATLNLIDAAMTGNTGNQGGAAHVHGTFNLTNVTLSGNTSTNDGGAVYFHGADGGSLTNVTFSGNTSTDEGGGLWTDTTITITNSTFALNNASDGGGIYTDGTTVNINNTIVSGNTATGANDDVLGSFNSNGFNLIEVVGAATGFGADPLNGSSAGLIALSDNGGPTDTHALLATSLAIDPAGLTGAPSADQRGVLRDGAPDIGAYEYANNPPTLTAFAGSIDLTSEDTEVEVTLAELATQGDENDSDGTVDAFLVKSVASGTLRIGASAAAATVWSAGSNDTIDAANHAFWTPDLNVNGTQNAFDVVARDNESAESAGSVTAQIDVTAVNDLPTFTVLAGFIETTNEDTEVEVTLGELAAQGDEADVDGTVDAFVVKSVASGTLRIGTSAATATAWAAGANDAINAANHAYWTPDLNISGPQNALEIVAKDNSGAESLGSVTAQIDVASVNDIPTLASFASAVETIAEDSEVEITLADLAAQGDEADVDGTVDAFLVKSIASGSLRIGASAATATAWTAGSNNTIDATNRAYWTPNLNANGTQNAFDVVAVDNLGAESIGPIAVRVDVTAVNDLPTLAAFAGVVETTNEDTLVEVTFADMAAQGDEADADGTVDGFVVKSVASGTLWIGANAATATLWVAGTNDTIDAADSAYWMPDLNVGGTQNAFDVVAKDDLGAESLGNVTAQIDVTPVNDLPTLTTFVAPIDTTNEDIEVELTFAEFAAQGDAADVDGAVSSLIVKAVSNGTLRIGSSAATATAWTSGVNDTIDATTNAYWTPPLNANGALSAVQVVARDDLGAESLGNVTALMNVTPVNDKPLAVTESYSVAENGTLTVAANGVLANDADIEGSPLTAALVAGTANGTLTLNADGSFTYTPNAGFDGADTFTYVANDGGLNSDPVVATITVNAAIGGPLPPPVEPPVEPEPDVDPVESDPLPVASAPPPASDNAPPPAPRPSSPRDGDTRSLLVLPVDEEVPVSILSATSSPLAVDSVATVVRGVRHRLPSAMTEAVDALSVPYDIELLSKDLDELNDDIMKGADLVYITAGTAAGATSALTVGYVVWTIRSGLLMTSLLAQMPAWRLIDPLAILVYLDEAEEVGDDSIEGMLKKSETDSEQDQPKAEYESAAD